MLEFHKSEEISKLLDSNYSDDIINKIKNFYFSEHHYQNEITKLENICHVSEIFFLFFVIHSI